MGSSEGKDKGPKKKFKYSYIRIYKEEIHIKNEDSCLNLGKLLKQVLW